MPTVSILIPTYNRGPTLRGCIDSALSQTLDDVEVIVYDDGSNAHDGCKIVEGKPIKIGETTDKAIAPFSRKPNFIYHYEQDNKGVAHARNQLMDMASGEYVMWLDSDDRCNRLRAELCVKAIEKYGRPYVRTSMTTFGQKEENTWKLPPILIYRGGVSFATILFPMKNRMDFDTRYDCAHEDMDWELRYAAKYGRSIQIPLTLYCVGRRTPDRLTMRYKDMKYAKKYQDCKALYEKKAIKMVSQMEANGHTKKPLYVPWDFVAEAMKSSYNKYYPEQA